MDTILTDSPQEAAEVIRRGDVVAFPTETVYGLGADAFNVRAVNKIFEAKRRPADNPLIVHISNLVQISTVAAEVTPSAQKLIDAFFPGPLTVVLKRQPELPLIVTAGLETVGVRMPQNMVAQAFLLACGTPVVAPSANLSGRPSTTTWQAVYEDLNRRIGCILKGDVATIGLESTVVDCTGEVPILLRPGAVTLEELKKIIPETRGDNLDNSLMKRSPGLQYRHYKPSAEVKLVSARDNTPADDRAAYIGLQEPRVRFAVVKVCSSVENYAHEIFQFFRECDRQNIRTIYCERVADTGIGRALMDRLSRASN